MQIAEVDEPVRARARARISIFMNVFNVHVNRYPTNGRLRHYNAGKFLNAATDKASLENEQMSVGIETGRARVEADRGTYRAPDRELRQGRDARRTGCAHGDHSLRLARRRVRSAGPSVRVKLGDLPIAA